MQVGSLMTWDDLFIKQPFLIDFHCKHSVMINYCPINWHIKIGSDCDDGYLSSRWRSLIVRGEGDKGVKCFLSGSRLMVQFSLKNVAELMASLASFAVPFGRILFAPQAKSHFHLSFSVHLWHLAATPATTTTALQAWQWTVLNSVLRAHGAELLQFNAFLLHWTSTDDDCGADEHCNCCLPANLPACLPAHCTNPRRC